ncbi:MAG TPA: response regulator, partial [Terriglobales bacterium]|nr:response regulator [Terriglobales bacterium]
NGTEALTFACDHPERIDLLLTDVILPGVNGRQVADNVMARRPGIRVLFMSGYTDDVVARQGVLEPGLRLLQKPFTVETLTAAVSAALLDGARPEDPPASGAGGALEDSAAS